MKDKKEKKFNKRQIINVLITLVIAFLIFYIFLPPLNIRTMEFWMYIIFIYIVYLLLSISSFFGYAAIKGDIKSIKLSKTYKIMIGVVPGLLLLILVVNIILSPMFCSGSYASRIEIVEGKKFEEEVKEVDFNKVPLLDKESTKKIGDRVMGEMTDLVSQFTVSDLYTQINYNNNIVRVTPLEYDGMIKYFTNRGKGITGYIIVDSVTGKAELVRLEKGMKYMPSAMFSENLYRKLRFDYPTEIFGDENFELDNEGNPYWVVPTIKYTGVGIKKEINGIVLMNPINGSTKRYKINEIPKWVDQVYSADLIIEQINDWGMYKNGFFNSIFSQNGVVQTTEGYNYLVKDDDVYMYTGITSVSTDESNIGFVLTNMRTKETNFYAVPGAEEYSAMASAEGQVQQMKYTSSFPLLINLNNRPTYLLSLKDNAGLVKMYAFVDVTDYQKVVVTDSTLGIEVASNNYLNNANLGSNGVANNNKDIIIKTINSAIIDGNTYYYLTDMEDKKYKVSIKINNSLLPFLKVGDSVNISYNKDSSVIDIVSIK